MIRLSQVTEKDWREVCRLTVTDGKTQFVAYNSYSLAQACYEPDSKALSIYHHDELVGFALVQKKEQEIWIVRFMIDRHCQKRGYGRKALHQLCEIFSGESLLTSYVPENHVAAALYKGSGFIPTGAFVDGEIVMIRKPN